MCMSGALCLLASWLASRGWLGSGATQRGLGFVALLLLTAGIAAGAWWIREMAWQKANPISNPLMPPETMNGEGDGPQGKFFPSSAQTRHGGNIPSKYFMQSDACQRCHGDIYKQWDSSVHHFSSFNNQWYRKSIEYMQDVARRAVVKMVRRLPRSGAALQRLVRYANQADCGSSGSPRGSSDA